MNTGVATPRGFGVRQPSGALRGDADHQKGAEDYRSPGRCRAAQGSQEGGQLSPRTQGCGRGILRLWGWLVLALALSSVGCEALGQAAGAKVPVRFRAVDIFVDSKETPLAAYQLEFAVTHGNAKIVGIEGGEQPAFAQPPFYDPKAMQHERVIIAAFSTEAADKLPRGKTRVATIHIQASKGTTLLFETKLQTAGGQEGKRLEAAVSAEERKVK